MIATYQIFNKRIKVDTVDSLEGSILHQELSVYPSVESEEYDLEVNYTHTQTESGILSKNPSTNVLRSNGFTFSQGPVSVSYHYNGESLEKINFWIKDSSKLFSWLNKFLNIQFTNHKEAIGQWFHEFVIVPIGLFIDNGTLLHSSGVNTEKKGAVLFGGTGGVGKTSLEIELCKNHGCSFITDDISYVKEDGVVFPNLAYPKIYGYNIKGNPNIKKQIFEGKSILDKFFFKIHSLRGDQFVRRRMSPEKFYGRLETGPIAISSYLILIKQDVDAITIDPIDLDKVIILSRQIIMNEYRSFIDHVVWHEYNSSLLGINPKVTEEIIRQKNEEILKFALSKAKLYMVKIPLSLSHEKFKRHMINGLREKEII